MILLLGASGYVGQAFAGELRRRGYSFIPLTRRSMDYSNFDLLFGYLRKVQPEFLINAAGYTGKSDVDTCERARVETLMANILLPQTVARACLMTQTPWGHVSSGCIYSGAKLVADGRIRIEPDLNHPGMRQLLDGEPENILGFNEWDEPNFSFRRQPCNFYSGSKALAEEVIHGIGRSYLWRPGLLFNEKNEPRNLLWKILNDARVYDGISPVSHVTDFVRAALNLWEREAPFGIYNMANPGVVGTRQVVAMMQRVLRPARGFEFWKDDAEFCRDGGRAPRSNCVLDGSKLARAGVTMRPVNEALAESLRDWQRAAPSVELVCH